MRAAASLCVFGTLILAAAPTEAQVLPGAVTPGRDRTGPLPPQNPDFDFSIVAPHRSAVPRAVDEVHFKLRDIKIVGVKTIPAEQFRALYAGMIGKDITLADILNVADAIEAAYRDRGYPLVRAYVPPQRVKDGVFTINVAEGYLANIVVQGADSRSAALISGYLGDAKTERPLRLAALERGLLLTNDIPGIKATGVLKPAANTPGASDLVVDVAQPWITGGLAVDNRGSRFSGVWTVAGDVEINSIIGADQLAGTVTVSPNSLEQVAGTVRYRTMIGDDGLVGSLIASITHGEPGSTLSAAGVRTDSYAVGPRLTFPLVRKRAATLLLDGGVTVQDARINVAGAPVSHDQWRVADLGLSYQRQDVFGGVLSATLDVAQGLPGLGATPNHDPKLSRVGGVTDFTKVTGFARLQLPLPSAFSVLLTTQGQYSFSPLITGEQIAFGGTQIGRGYDPGAITGDHGIGGSAELRYDQRIADSIVQAVQPYLYFDAAQAWYVQRGLAISAALKDQNIASVGGGVRLWFPYNIAMGIEGARTLHAVPGSDAGKLATKLLVDLSVRF